MGGKVEAGEDHSPAALACQLLPRNLHASGVSANKPQLKVMFDKSATGT
jgi:hypothetical protein